jgi:hypothetical protein
MSAVASASINALDSRRWRDRRNIAHASRTPRRPKGILSIALPPNRSTMKQMRAAISSIDRRSFCSGVGAAFVFSASCRAQEKQGLDGTWGGAQNGVTAQVIIVGTTVIGFYWRNDYLDAESPKFSDNGRTLSFAFRGGKATLKRTGERTATIAVAERGNVMNLELRRD